MDQCTSARWRSLLISCAVGAALVCALIAPRVSHAQTEEEGEVDEVGDDGAAEVTEEEADAAASEPFPEQSLSYLNLFAARYNPLGIQNTFTLSYRHRLYASDIEALKTNYVGVNAIAAVGGVSRIGVGLDIMPLSVLRLGVSYEFVGIFEAIHQHYSFPTANVDYSDTVLDEADDDDQGATTWGTTLTLSALLQVKFWQIAARTNIKAMYNDYQLVEDEDRVWYDNTYDIMTPNEGWTMSADTDLLWVSEFGLIIGARHTWTRAFYDEDVHVLDGESAPDTEHHRVGPLFAYQFEVDPPVYAFEDPTLLLVVNWYVKHRYRTGPAEEGCSGLACPDVHQGIPYVVLGFAFSGDFEVFDTP